MKYFILMMFAFACGSALAQKKSLQNYPVLVNPTITTVEKEDLNANQLYKGQVVQLAFGIFNPNQSETIKAGSCLLQVELGDKLKPAQKEMSRLKANDYFHWTIVNDESGKTFLSGSPKADLPADFFQTVFVELQCAETGSSTIKAQWADDANTRQGVLNTLEFTIKKNKPKE